MNKWIIKTGSSILFFAIILLISSNSYGREYTVGEGDVIKIVVYEHKDLTSLVRLNNKGFINLPLIGNVFVKKMTVSQISRKLEALFEDGYIVNPQVSVTIKKYSSRKAIILGKIKKPGIYELRADTTFLEIISKAGGLASEAATFAIIKRKLNSKNLKDSIIRIDLEKLIQKGETSLNVQVLNGDNIYIPEAEELNFYVTGEVKKPDVYKFEKETTIIKAITLAGGLTGKASTSGISIIRQKNGKEIVVKNVSMDQLIKVDDVIVIPESFF